MTTLRFTSVDEYNRYKLIDKLYIKYSEERLMDKREARQIVLHIIFEMEFKLGNWNEITKLNFDADEFLSISQEEGLEFYAKKCKNTEKKYIRNCVEGIVANLEEIDGYISSLSKGWDIKRISKVSLAILRLSIYEIKYTQVPTGASINEAVDLAKDYDSEEAGGFVNGILGTFERQNNG